MVNIYFFLDFLFRIVDLLFCKGVMFILLLLYFILDVWFLELELEMLDEELFVKLLMLELFFFDGVFWILFFFLSLIWIEKFI